MRKAVAYYRSRPSEPEASGLALRLQREAVRKAVEEGSLDLIGEFTEREGESGTEGCPAYIAAARMAHGQGELVEFLIASRAAIGSGEPFKEPDIAFEPPDDQDIFGQGFITCELLTPSVERASEITLPNGAPGPLWPARRSRAYAHAPAAGPRLPGMTAAPARLGRFRNPTLSFRSTAWTDRNNRPGHKATRRIGARPQASSSSRVRA